MSTAVEGIDKQHYFFVKTKTQTGEDRDLVFISGTAYFVFQGTGSNFVREEFTVDIGPHWRSIEHVAPMAALATWQNLGPAVYAGAAVDWCEWTPTAMGPVDRKIRLHAQVGVSDSDGIVYRFAFSATAIGILSPGQMPVGP
jgi:hypothetical protein